MDWKRKRLGFIGKPPLLFLSIYVFFFLSISSLLFFSTASSSTIFICPDNYISCSLSAKAGTTYFQESKKSAGKMLTVPNEVRKVVHPLSQARRNLAWMGSSPPRCLWKCGSCTPCKPVHVPIPPGKPVTTEYYPEAWRCKCGNKLYMP